MPGQGKPDARGQPIRLGPQRRRGDRSRAGAPTPRVIGPCPHVDELRGLGGPFEDLLAGDTVTQHLPGRGRVSGAVHVAPPDVERRDVESLGDPVEVGLGGELGLRGPEAAECAVRRRVRPGRLGADAHVRTPIRPAGMDRAARQDDRRQRAVRPTVHHDVDLLCDQHPIVGHPGPVTDDGRVSLGGGRDVLVAVVDHADRLLRLPGKQRRMERDDGRELLLPTEATTGLRLDDPGAVIVEPETALQRCVDVVRALERAGDGDAALRRHGDHRVVLDVELLLVAHAVLALEDEVRGGERGIRITAVDGVRGEDVVRGVRLEDGRELGGPGCDPAPRFAQRGSIRRGDQRQRFRVMEDLAADRDEDRLVVLDGADDVVARDVVGGDDHDP